MNKKFYDKEFSKLLKKESKTKFFIKKSNAKFKIEKYKEKALQNFELVNYILKSNQSAKDYWSITISYYSMLYLAKAIILTKNYETDDHYSTQIALAHLFLKKNLDEKDINAFQKAHETFENEYIDYFHDARKESNVSRYSTTKSYNERRVKEITHNTRKFLNKLLIILEK